MKSLRRPNGGARYAASRPLLTWRLLSLAALMVASVGAYTVAPNAEASTTALTSVADTYSSQVNDSSGHGALSWLRVDGDPIRRTYLRFDLQGVDVAAVSRATLRVYTLTDSSDGFDVRAVSDDGWTEDGLTYSNAPAVSSEVVGSSGSFALGVWANVDVSTLLGDRSVLSLALTTDATRGLYLGSRETGATAPQLVVEAGTVDSTPPSAPTGLSAAVTDGGQVALTWSPATDDVGVAGYTLYRDGGALAQVPAETTAYIDAEVATSTTYAYSVDAFDAAGNHSSLSTVASVTTPGPDPSPSPSPAEPVVAAAGDIACDPSSGSYNGGEGTVSECRMRATSDLLADADAVLTLGDNQYEDGRLTDYQTSYDPTWGRFKGITHPVPGNHEYHTAGAAGYYAYFGAAAGAPSAGYYSFDIGGWHVIALNSNCSEVGGCGQGSPQEMWLRADLAAHPSMCELAYWHHPRFSSGAEHGSDATYSAFWEDLHAAGAEIVLNGHDHGYERFAPQDPAGRADANGIREFVVGTGGKNHYSFASALPNSEVRESSTFGVLVLTLRTEGYAWAFTPEQGETFSDSGEGVCH